MKIRSADFLVKRRGIELIPLVDVMFNLLIFFIFAMLSMAVYQGVTLQLPQVHGTALDHQKPIVIQIDRTGKMWVHKQQMDANQLRSFLKQTDLSQSIHVAADQRAAYGQVMQWLGRLEDWGYRKVSLLTDQP